GVEAEIGIHEVTAECPIPEFGKDVSGPVEPEYRLDFPHQVSTDAKTSYLTAHSCVIRFVEIETTTQPDVGIKPIIVSRDSSVQFRVECSRNLVRDLRFGRIDSLPHSSPTCSAPEPERIDAYP